MAGEAKVPARRPRFGGRKLLPYKLQLIAAIQRKRLRGVELRGSTDAPRLLRARTAGGAILRANRVRWCPREREGEAIGVVGAVALEFPIGQNRGAGVGRSAPRRFAAGGHRSGIPPKIGEVYVGLSKGDSAREQHLVDGRDAQHLLCITAPVGIPGLPNDLVRYQIAVVAEHKILAVGD